MRKIVFGVMAVMAAAWLAGCEAEVPEVGSDEPSALSSGGKEDRLRVCPLMLIMCAEGYHAKSVGNCRQVCVPDSGAECQSDADCTIYCITSPCPVGECRGNQCRVSTTKPPRSQSCTPGCGAGESCQECKTVDGSALVCLPDGSIC